MQRNYICASRDLAPLRKKKIKRRQHANDDPLFSHPQGETLDIFEFIARVLTQILRQAAPQHLIPSKEPDGVRYFGAYSSSALDPIAKLTDTE